MAVTIGVALMLSRPLWDRSAAPVGAGPATAPVRDGASIAAHARSLPLARTPALSPRAAAPAGGGDAARAASVHLAFAMPHMVTLGSAADLAASGLAGVPGGVALDVTYDARVLRARSIEELDYTDGRLARGGYAAIEDGEGRLHLEPVPNVLAGQAGRQLVSLVQFEALAPGTTSVAVAVAASDDGAAPAVRFDVPTCDCQITVN